MKIKPLLYCIVAFGIGSIESSKAETYQNQASEIIPVFTRQTTSVQDEWNRPNTDSLTAHMNSGPIHPEHTVTISQTANYARVDVKNVNYDCSPIRYSYTFSCNGAVTQSSGETNASTFHIQTTYELPYTLRVDIMCDEYYTAWGFFTWPGDGCATNCGKTFTRIQYTVGNGVAYLVYTLGTDGQLNPDTYAIYSESGTVIDAGNIRKTQAGGEIPIPTGVVSGSIRLYSLSCSCPNQSHYYEISF